MEDLTKIERPFGMMDKETQEPTYGWKEYEVIEEDGFYSFTKHGARWTLNSAPDMVGFGGILFEGRNQYIFAIGECDDYFDHPLRPIKVRFLETLN